MEIDDAKLEKAEAAIDSLSLTTAERLALIDTLLGSTFEWKDSPQGADYWAKVSDSLDMLISAYIKP